MKLKRITVPLKQKAGKVLRRIKEMPFESEPLLKKPGYIDLSGKLATQKAFAALGGIKGATRRAIRRVRGAAKDRLKHGLLSPEAVERVTNREIAKATERASTPLKQDIKGAITNTKTSIMNTPQNLKTAAVKTKNIAKDIYENTGDMMAKTAGWARKNPELALSQIPAGATRIAGVVVAPVNPAAAAALQAVPVTAPTLAVSKLVSSPYKVVTYKGNKMPRFRKRILAGKKAERKVSSVLGGKSIKGAVENVGNILSLPPTPRTYRIPVMS